MVKLTLNNLKKLIGQSNNEKYERQLMMFIEILGFLY